jgi:hypothetical protein
MRRINLDRVGQRKQLLMQRVIEHRGHLRGRVAARTGQIGSAHVADKERVAGQNHSRLTAVVSIEDQQRDAFGRVAGRFEHAQSQTPDPELVALLDGPVREGRARLCAEDDFGAGSLGQLTMSADEVRMQVRLDDVLNPEPLRGGLCEVLLDVALRVNHRRLSFGPDEIRSVGQTAEIELLEVHHRRNSSLGVCRNQRF